MILTGYAAFTTSAGYIGPKYRVDHDISMLVPEIWCRMTAAERDPEIPHPERGFSRSWRISSTTAAQVLASRLGYRITDEFGELFPRPHFRNSRTTCFQKKC